MASIKFNPFTNKFDYVGSGGGTSYIDGEVADSSLLPVTLGSPAIGDVYLAKAGSGVWLINRRPAGLYSRTANNGNLDDWTYLSAFPEVQADSRFRIYNATDATKEIAFDASAIAAGTTRTITVPNKNVTLGVNADWNASSGDAQILNKPTLGGAAALDVGTAAGEVAEGNHTHELNALAATGISAGKVLVADGDNTASWQDAPAGGDTVSINASAADVLSVSSGAISAVDATADKIVFWDDSASALKYLEAGSGLSISGTTLTATASGGSKTYATFTATDNQPPASNYATLDTRNSIAVLDFDDAADESAVFVSIIPEAASLGSGLKIRLHWMATTATSGDCVWDVSLERMTTDLDSDSFDTIASGTAAANGTSGILTVTEITLTTIDSVTAGDSFRLKVTRDADNASDTMTGDAELVVAELRSAA